MAMKSAQARETKTCGQCGIREDQGETFNHCSRCKVVSYCSKACQKQHWRGGHKDTCQAASEREDTMKKSANKTVDYDKPSTAPGKKKPHKALVFIRRSSGRRGAESTTETEAFFSPGHRTNRCDGGSPQLRQTRRLCHLPRHHA